jgi:hypothetical protein
MAYSHESGLGLGPLDVATTAGSAAFPPLALVGVGTKILGSLFGKPVSEDEQLRRNDVAYQLAITGDNDALAFLKARGGLTQPISNNLLAKQFGSTDGYVANTGSKYPRVGPDAKAKATAIMGSVTGGTTLTSPVQTSLASMMPTGMSPILLGLLGVGLLLSTTRKGR